ncbi:MAG: SH3 domain-containing protein [Sandaracinaceae bacterium]|nr:SH3 domain-containing protein [Sandaracinaceae bacterium]
MTTGVYFAILIACLPALAQPASGLAGGWAREDRRYAEVLRFDVSIEDGRAVAAGWTARDEFEVSGPVAAGSRLVLRGSGERAADTLVLEAVSAGARVVSGRLGGDRIAPGPLLRADALYQCMRDRFVEMGHDEGTTPDYERIHASFDAVREGLLAAGARAATEDPTQAMCMYEGLAARFELWQGGGRACPTMASASCRRQMTAIRAWAGTVARATVGGSVCAASDDVMVGAGVCTRLEVHDADGQTTVRREPRSSSPALTTLPNGTIVDVADRRGTWVRAEAPDGWIFAGNLRCPDD